MAEEIVPISSLVLHLQPDHPCSTHIRDAGSGQLLYVVDTEVQQPSKRAITEIRKAAGDMIATFEWRPRNDLVTFGPKGQPEPVSEWLKRSIIPFKETVSFKNEAMKSFKWRNNAPGLSLELYSDTDRSTTLTKFSKSRKAKGKPSTPATLVIHESIGSSSTMLDQVIISFLYLEKARREFDDDNFHALA